MTIINSNYSSGGYYQLGSQQNTSTSAPLTLAAALQQQTDQSSSNSADSAYQLNLSSDANDYLNSLLGATNQGNSNSTNTADSIPDNFVLSPAQKEQLSSIIQKYKDAPQTQDTFNHIQDDLKKAGLDPDTLAAKEQATSFNPTQVLIAILSGKSSSDINPTDPQEIQAKYDKQKSNYLQQVATMWKNISTTGTDEAAATAAS